MTEAPCVPVIAVDGPAASGKGTLAAGVARALGFHLLDSGALYRLVALKAERSGTRPDDVEALARLAAKLDAHFADGGVRLDGDDVTAAIRDEGISAGERARRRHKQLIEKGISVTLDSLLRELLDRDARDTARTVAPLKAAADAVILDTTDLTIDEAIALVLKLYRARSESAVGG